MKKKNSWILRERNSVSLIKRKLSSLANYVRQEQFKLFLKNIKPQPSDKVVDIGVSAVETLPEINFFEKRYPFPERLTAVSIDEPLGFLRRYPKMEYVQIKPGEKLPFNDKSFDIVTSWATLEHVGDHQKQQYFLRELFRIGKKVFITTPDRRCFYEPHTELFFIHWLPRYWFQRFCRLTKKDYWASEENLRFVSINDIKKMLPKKRIKIFTYKLFGFIPTHLIIIKD